MVFMLLECINGSLCTNQASTFIEDITLIAIHMLIIQLICGFPAVTRIIMSKEYTTIFYSSTA